jgi:hypothetical protein
MATARVSPPPRMLSGFLALLSTHDVAEKMKGIKDTAGKVPADEKLQNEGKLAL